MKTRMLEKSEAVVVKQNNSLTELPRGWAWAVLDDACDIILGQSPPSSTYNENGDGLPFYQGKTEFGKLYPTPKKWCSSPNKIAEKNDVLISVRAPVGPTNICPEKSCIGRGLAAIRGLGDIRYLFILYLIRAIEPTLSVQGTGTTFKAITGDKLRNLSIPLPPLPEQHRIVAKIEELVTRLDSGIDALKKVRKELKRYHQAVLKHAFEGKLTKKWREKNKDKLEPASKLLERIAKEREKNAKGKKKKVLPLDKSELPELPKGWEWTNVDTIIETLSDYHANAGYKILKKNVTLLDKPDYAVMVRTKNFSKNDFNSSLKYISKHAYNFLWKSQLYGEEVVIGKIGNAGKVYWMPKFNKPCSLGMNMFLLRFNEFTLNRYIYFHLTSSFSKEQIHKKVKGVGNPTIDKKSIRSLYIAFPPTKEQKQIVSEIEHHFSVADEIEQTIEKSLKQAQRLRQSILKKAFEGKLVPQDPNDEPVSKLLERIKAEKAKLQTKQKVQKI